MGYCATAQEKVAAADVSQDDLGVVTDEFKEKFFDALAQKAIGNHDKALALLDDCLEMQPENAAVWFEKAKNELAGLAFAKAEQSLNRAIAIAGPREWLLKALFETYDHQNEYQKGLTIMEQLSDIDDAYRSYLPELYLRLNQPDRALAVLDELDSELGGSNDRDDLRSQIMSNNRGDESDAQAITRLEKRIASDPQDDKAYISLIYLYGKTDDRQNLDRVAAQFADELPENDAVHLAIYKLRLDEGNVEEAKVSLKRILESGDLPTDTKFNVLTDFLQLAESNAQLDPVVLEAIDWFSPTGSGAKTYRSIAEYFYRKGRKDEALLFYEKAIAEQPTDLDILVSSALLAIDLEKYDLSLERSETANALYPAQPLPYLLIGVVHNATGKYKMAITTLNEGLDYIIDEISVQHDLYEQLAQAHTAVGNETDAAAFTEKAAALKQQIENEK